MRENDYYPISSILSVLHSVMICVLGCLAAFLAGELLGHWIFWRQAEESLFWGKPGYWESFLGVRLLNVFFFMTTAACMILAYVSAHLESVKAKAVFILLIFVISFIGSIYI